MKKTEMNSGRFPAPVINALHKSKILGVRAGHDHRFTGIWVVVVDDRIFVRSWDNKPNGWYREFIKNRIGAIQIPNGREIPVRARKVTGERFLNAIDAAYAEKYHTPASRKYVRGLASPKRRRTTLELVPA